MSVAIQGPQEGAMLPDFTMHFHDGRVLYRRELKGRLHAVISFPPTHPAREEQASLPVITGHIPAWRAVRAVVLVVLPAADADVTANLSFDPVIDRDGTVRARFGVGPGGALFVADRYGEITLRADGAVADAGAVSALPFDEVTPILELLEMRCTL